jgi:hypothetical protein
MGTFANIREGSFGGQVGAPCGCIGCFDELDHVQGSWQYSRKSTEGKKGTMHARDYNSLVCALDQGAGPAPPAAPANKACFAGVGDFSPTSGQKTERVAFRVQVEDRGEPGSADVYRIWIWTESSGMNADKLAEAACCLNPVPAGASIIDGGVLVSGNIQIHPELPKSEVCPRPKGECPNL